MSAAPTGMRQTVLVTAVPRGYRGSGIVEIAAVVSPRLHYTGDRATLADFPDWLTWPQQVSDWEVSLAKGAPGSWRSTTVLSEISPDPLWPDLFDDATRVASYDGDPGPARTAFGYSYATLAAAVTEAYQLPDLADSQLATAVSRGLPPAQPGPAPTADVTAAISQYLGFWRPVGNMAPARGALAPDFHERLALLADHPGFLEAIGLVVRLQLVLGRGTVPNTVRVRPAWTPPSGLPTSMVTPDTRVDTAGGRYAPALRTADVRYDDRLRLAVSRPDVFTVHSIDVDASVAQLISVVRGRQSPTTAEASAPSARGGGLTLAMTGRMQQLQDRLTKGRQSALAARSNPTAPPQVWAEDLIVGHHLQVGVGPADAPAESVRWYGLGHRQTDYFTTRARWSVVDEAPVTLAARRQDPAKATRLLVSDVMTRWDGWSLALPHPARRQRLQDDPTGTTVAEEPGRPMITSLDFQTSLPEQAADGSDPRLPPLRFGRTYRFRGRAVDLSGGAPVWTDAPATPPATYWRWEAAASPLVLPPPELTRTEDATRLVVRSDPRAGVAPTVRSSRVLVPPRVSVDTGLRHGVFDTEQGVPDGDRYTTIRDLDGVLPPRETGAPLATGYPAPFRVAWLPDPMTTDVHLDVGNEPREASFVGLGDPDPLGVASLGSWAGLGLVLTGLPQGATSSTSAVEQTASTRRVRVGLRPGGRVRIAARAIPREQRAAEHGVVDLLPGNLGGKLDRLSRESVPTINPDRLIELVHAVKRPLRDPAVTAATADRSAGQQNPLIDAVVAVEPETSGRVTVLATWSAWQDAGPKLRTDPGWSAPVRVTSERNALLDVDLAPVETPLKARTLLPTYEYAEQLVLPDLRRRDVDLTVTATSRFVEEFRESTPMTFTEKPAGSGQVYLDLDADVQLASVVLSVPTRETNPDGSRQRRRLGAGRDYVVAIDPQTAQHTLRLTSSFLAETDDRPDVEAVRGRVLATSVQARRVVVPSAVRPSPPTLVHALPSWFAKPGELRGDLTAYASRGQSLLRLYLERPWWSSGDGEQLAVVVGHDHQDGVGFPEDTSLLSKAVTLYGLDPALRVTVGTPRTAPLASGTVVSGLPLEQDLGTSDQVLATVAAHDVTYHEGRDLYVAELAFPAKPAGTFVRLAIARYQPFVGAGVPHLSPVVTLDPVQLLPPRTVIVRNDTQGRLRVAVGGNVHTGQDAAQAPRLRVSLQRRARPGAGDDLGWDTVDSKDVAAVAGTYPNLTIGRDSASGEDFRVLVEEIEQWLPATGTNPAYVRDLTTVGAAIDDLTAERVTWVATLPLPEN